MRFDEQGIHDTCITAGSEKTTWSIPIKTFHDQELQHKKTWTNGLIKIKRRTCVSLCHLLLCVICRVMGCNFKNAVSVGILLPGRASWYVCFWHGLFCFFCREVLDPECDILVMLQAIQFRIKCQFQSTLLLSFVWKYLVFWSYCDSVYGACACILD
jgi:hypothetical protein